MASILTIVIGIPACFLFCWFDIYRTNNRCPKCKKWYVVERKPSSYYCRFCNRRYNYWP